MGEKPGMEGVGDWFYSWGDAKFKVSLHSWQMGANLLIF